MNNGGRRFVEPPLFLLLPVVRFLMAAMLESAWRRQQDVPEAVEDIIDELAKLGVHIHFDS